jgi:hypothetical protein
VAWQGLKATESLKAINSGTKEVLVEAQPQKSKERLENN